MNTNTLDAPETITHETIAGPDGSEHELEVHTHSSSAYDNWSEVHFLQTPYGSLFVDDCDTEAFMVTIDIADATKLDVAQVRALAAQLTRAADLTEQLNAAGASGE